MKAQSLLHAQLRANGILMANEVEGLIAPVIRQRLCVVVEQTKASGQYSKQPRDDPQQRCFSATIRAMQN